MHELINSYMITSSLIAGHQLNIFKLIVAKPLSLLELSNLIKSDNPQKIYALLFYLCKHNFIEVVDGLYSANQYTRELADPNKPYGLMLTMIANEYLPASLMIGNAILANQTAYELAHGQNIWDHRRNSSRLGDDFQKCIDIQARAVTSQLVESWPWFEYLRIVDIAGGMGALASAIKLKHPLTKVALFETPEQCNLINRLSPTDNAVNVDQLIEGNFFHSIPLGFDAYILKSVLHDWVDHDCLKILEKITKAAKKADLLVIERVLGFDTKSVDNNTYNSLPYQNLLMSTLHGSQERSQNEWLKIFTAAKLDVLEIVFLECGFCIFKLRVRS